MPPKTRRRRTKEEVQQEFSLIAEEAAETKASTSAHETVANQLQETAIRAAVSGIAAETISLKIAELNTEISRTLSNLSEKLVAEVDLLHRVKAAITIENDQLQKLHKIDIAATSLEQLIEEHQNKSRELELERSMKRAEWEKAKIEQEEMIKTFEKDLKLARSRESDEFDYKRTVERKKDQDKYDEECSLRDKQNRDKQEALEKNWAIREEALKTRETQLQELQKSVDSFPARLKEATDKTHADAVQITEQRFSQQLLILQKDREAEQRIAEMKIRSLEENNTRLLEQTSRLQKQLEEAKKEVKEIAEKAIEGASGARTLSHVNQIAIEQAKHRSSQS